MPYRPRLPLRRLAANGAVGVAVLVPIAAPSSAATHGEKYCEEKLRDAPPGSVCEDLGNGNILFVRGTPAPVGDDAPTTPADDVVAPPDRTVDTSPGNRGLVALAFVAGVVGIGSAARRRSSAASDGQRTDVRKPAGPASPSATPRAITGDDDAPARRADATPSVTVAPVIDRAAADAEENDDEPWKPPAG